MRMNPIFLVCAGMMLFAIQNTIVEHNLSKYSVFTLSICIYSVILPLTLIIQFMALKITGEQLAMPSGNALWIAFLAGAFLLSADLCYLGAYTNGGNIITITTIAIMLPVFASVIKAVVFHELPNMHQVIGYGFAVVAVFFTTKGN